jgi:predicted aldo/keto reductase-like oxidoreductase
MLSDDFQDIARNSWPAIRRRALLLLTFCCASPAPFHPEDGLMSENASNPIHRREFIQVGAVATAAATTLTQGAAAAQVALEQAKEANKKPELPRRMLGRTGVEVTLVDQGTVRQPDALDQLLRYSYSRGVRYFDTAAAYRTEPAFKKWFAAMPEVRKQIFLATKDGVRRPGDMVKKIDQRLAALGTDYIDLLFFHGLDSAKVDWPKSKEMKEAVEAIKKTGKVKFVGFSTHDPRKAEQIQAAAQGGFIDVIMLAFSPFLAKDDPINRALDAAHAKGIGLVSMKQMAGHTKVKDNVPALLERGLTTHQGLLTAIWSDPRISATCVTMANRDQVNQNTDAARRFTPLKEADIHALRDAVLAAGPMMCADCDGRCGRAAGTNARLGELTRFLTYHEHHGSRQLAHESYAELTEEERNWRDADLEAAREACPSKLNFAQLLPEVDRLLG